MLRLLSLVAALMSLLPAAAQHVASMECGLEEYRPLLSAAGFEAYAFDIRDFLKNDGRYTVTLRVREYATAARSTRRIMCWARTRPF